MRELPRRRLLKARLIGAGAVAQTPRGAAQPSQPAGLDAQDDVLGPDGHDDDVPDFPGFLGSVGADPDSRGK
jgi:hypothetical protein